MQDPRITHKYIKYIGRELPCNVRLVVGIKHQFQAVGEVIPVTPAQHAAMLRHPMLYADATEAEFSGEHATLASVAVGDAVGGRADAFVIPAADVFCRKTMGEIKSMDYTHVPAEIIQGYLDYEMQNRSRSGVAGYLEHLVGEKIDGSYRFDAA